MAFVWVLVGLVCLVGGGELLVRGATEIALRLRISPAVVGLTIVAAGTSMPELLVSVQAAMAGSPDIAAGNVVGSNIFNIALILGLAALLQPLQIAGATVKLEWPVMMLAAMQMYILCRDGLLDRVEGIFFLAALVAFLAYLVKIARTDAPAEEVQELSEWTEGRRPEGKGWALQAGLVLGGVVLLGLGSTALIEGATEIARGLGVSEAVIGLTIVSGGTSLPELAASVVAALKKNADIAVANVIGSNTFNVLGIAGVTAIIHPLNIAGEILARDLWWMLGVSAGLFPLMYTGRRVERWEGGILVVAYLVYLWVLWPR